MLIGFGHGDGVGAIFQIGDIVGAVGVATSHGHSVGVVNVQSSREFCIAMSHDSECGFTLNHLFISVTHITWYIIHFQRVDTKVGVIEINSDSLTGFHGEIGIIKVGNSHIVNGYTGHHGLDIISRILEFHLVVNIFKFGYNFERISVGHISIIVGTAGNEFFTIKEHFIEYIGIVGRTNLKRSFLSRHERNFHPFAIGKAHCRISSRAKHIYLGGIINLHEALGCARTFNA